MSAPPYMKLYVADYLGDTHDMGVMEHGAYLLLLMGMWRAGGKLPADDAKLAKVAHCTPEQWAAVRETVLPFFRRRGGQLTHKRLAAEMAKYETVASKRREASEKGVSAKRRKNNEMAEPNGSPSPVHLVAKPEPDPEPEREGIEPSLSTARESAASPVLTEDLIAEAQARIAEAGVELDATEHAKRFLAHAEATGRKLVRPNAAWREWIRREIEKAPEKAAAPPSAISTPSWNGPADLLNAIRAETDIGWARAWIERETHFQHVPAPPALIAHSALARSRIEERVGDLLRANGIDLRKAGAAA